MTIEVLLGGGDIAMTLDASAAVGDMVVGYNGTGYPVRRVGDFEPPSASYATAALGQAELSNGNIVVVYLNTSYYPTFVIYNPTMTTEVVSPTVIQAVDAAAENMLQVSSIAGGNWIVTWRNGSTGFPTFAIFSNAGAVVKAATGIDGNACISFSPASVAHAQLSGGNIALAWGRTADNYFYYAVIDPTGTTVKAPTNVRASVYGGSWGNFRVAAAPTGDTFSIGIIVGATWWLHAYNSVGTETGTIEGFSTDNNVSSFDMACTSDGRYVIAAGYGTTYIGIRWFNSIAQVISSQYQAVTTKPAHTSLVIDSADRAFAVGHIIGEHGLIWGASKHSDGNYRWDGTAILSLGAKEFPRASPTIGARYVWAVRNPHGGVIASFVYNAYINSMNHMCVDLIRISSSESSSLAVSEPVTFKATAGDDGTYTRAFKPLATKALLSWGYGYQGPKIMITNIAPILGVMSAAGKIKQTGKYTTTNGKWPAGRSLKSLPSFGGSVIDAAFVSSTDLILGS